MSEGGLSKGELTRGILQYFQESLHENLYA